MATNIGIPKGTRDFTPDETVRRNYIFDTIRQVFQKFGYLPIETPAMENLSTLLGKYGDEGDKLIFKILNSGDYLSKTKKDLAKISSYELTQDISEKALRFDLTVPFARFVVMHQHELTFPFKRYQIQPVWRADRPQKGRYREFYQCDVDVIGSNSLLNEVELVQIIDTIFEKLKVPVAIKLNNRKVLSGIAEFIGESEKIVDITVAIDKLDKIGLDKVNEELANKGVSSKSIEKLQPIINLQGTNNDKLSTLRILLKNSEIGIKGLEELETVFEYTDFLAVKSNVEFDITLARGLNYYTGAIFEAKPTTVQMGSIAGGGRYDDLTGIFGLKNMSGVGVSFGADRIYDVMDELMLFPDLSSSTSQILFVNFGMEEAKYNLPLLGIARNAGINAELYPEPVKVRKQLDYANSKGIPYVVMIGTEEIKSGVFTIRNMETGEQQKVNMADIIEQFMQ